MQFLHNRDGVGGPQTVLQLQASPFVVSSILILSYLTRSLLRCPRITIYTVSFCTAFKSQPRPPSCSHLTEDPDEKVQTRMVDPWITID